MQFVYHSVSNACVLHRRYGGGAGVKKKKQEQQRQQQKKRTKEKKKKMTNCETQGRRKNIYPWHKIQTENTSLTIPENK